VYGVVFELSEFDFKYLDKIENPNSYMRKQMRINTEKEKSLEYYLYLAIPEGDISPDKEYLELIIKVGKTAQLPKEYIKFLESFL